MEGESATRVYTSMYPTDHDRVKEEDAQRASHLASLPVTKTPALPAHYGSPTSLPPPPPPPAAYSSPPEHDPRERNGSIYSQHSRHDAYPDDPIPPPPAKYSFPSLPSISEALKRQESQAQPRAVAPEESREYRRRYSTESQSADRYTQSESYTRQRPPISTPFSDAPPTASNTMALSNGIIRRDSAFSSTSDNPLYQARAPPSAQPAAYADDWRSDYSCSTRESQYYPSYPARPAFEHSSSREQMPPPPGPSTIYAPSLSNPHTPTTASMNSAYPPARPVAIPGVDEKRLERPIYGQSVKRHLDTFDLENALNLMSESSREISDFSEYYRLKAHNTQRTGPLPGTTPHVSQIEDMMKHGSRIYEALNRLREIVNTQQAELAEQSREKAAKLAAADRMQQDEKAGAGGFAGSDAKKRRGRAAPPGKCHSCNRIDTPEWRRGPDGARTLCNACGLHYAKLTRKSGTGKATQGSSNLQPKANSHDS